jgi:Glycosyl transferase 4-like domain
MLAVVARFKWVHIDYLKALEEHFDVRIAWSGEGGKGAPQDGLREGLRGVPIGWTRDLGADEVRTRLERVLSDWPPDLVHLMYYNHDDLTLIARDLVGEGVPIVYECRDPQTTLSRAAPGSEIWARERDAIVASDAQIFVSRALRSYLERSHSLELGESSLVVPASFARHTIAPPSPKLSARDGRVHIALVGTADDAPDHGRWYVEIIRRLVSLGLVVHSHFHDLKAYGLSLEPYLALASELDDYHFHPTVSHRQGTALSELISRYDLMGVFHELGATHHNESPTLAVCMPTKSVCGWLHGGVPVVCFPHYGGVVEWIDALGVGFVIERWEDLRRIAFDRAAIAAATARCLACRDRFTTEHNAARIREFVGPLLGAGRATAPALRYPSPRQPAPGGAA